MSAPRARSEVENVPRVPRRAGRAARRARVGVYVRVRGAGPCVWRHTGRPGWAPRAGPLGCGLYDYMGLRLCGRDREPRPRATSCPC
eukprot:6331811-Prymnesium_polylepis.1